MASVEQADRLLAHPSESHMALTMRLCYFPMPLQVPGSSIPAPQPQAADAVMGAPEMPATDPPQGVLCTLWLLLAGLSILLAGT